MSHFVFRVKNDRELKTRILYSVLNENPWFAVKGYREEPDLTDQNYQIIRLAAYEKGPYCHLKKILSDLAKNKEIECLDETLSIEHS
jgi:alpha-L-fucosidase